MLNEAPHKGLMAQALSHRRTQGSLIYPRPLTWSLLDQHGRTKQLREQQILGYSSICGAFATAARGFRLTSLSRARVFCKALAPGTHRHTPLKPPTQRMHPQCVPAVLQLRHTGYRWYRCSPSIAANLVGDSTSVRLQQHQHATLTVNGSRMPDCGLSNMKPHHTAEPSHQGVWRYISPAQLRIQHHWQRLLHLHQQQPRSVAGSCLLHCLDLHRW